MIKRVIKNQKGINLISLTISVMVILTLTGTILYNLKDNLGIQDLKNMQVDIANLQDKVSSYYAQYGEIPVDKTTEYTNIEHLKKSGIISEEVDTGLFYIIDLSALENVTLSYGLDYEKVDTEVDINMLEDLYIINETSHNIFYVKGITLDEEIFYSDYTKDAVDKVGVELKYPDGINVTHEIWSPRYNNSAIYKDENEDMVYIPEGFQVSRKAGETTIADGLVVQNSETEERYVWIQVPETVFVTSNSETDYKSIEKDLKTYTADYVIDNYEDSYYEGCGISTAEAYNKLKNKMLSSIYKNKGFWISQYEIGSGEIRTNGISKETDSLSKEGEYPYNYVTIEQAQTLATSKSNSENYTGSLMFGVQWDLVLKFIETSGVKQKSEIINNSSNWGNYMNSAFSVTKGKYGTTSWQNVNETFSKSSTESIMLSTGISERNKVLNIYDLAGNMEEWTLEHRIDGENPCVTRGGSYINGSSDSYVSKRSDKSNIEKDSNIGFRISLY